MMLSNRFQTIGNQLFYIFKSFVHGDLATFTKLAILGLSAIFGDLGYFLNWGDIC